MSFLRRLQQWIRRLQQRISSMSAAHAAITFAILGIVVMVLGFVNQYGVTLCSGMWNPGTIVNLVIMDFYGDIAMTLIGTALTVLVIDRLYERSADEQLKARLIRQVGIRHSLVALPAFEELNALKWLQNGSMRGLK